MFHPCLTAPRWNMEESQAGEGWIHSTRGNALVCSLVVYVHLVITKIFVDLDILYSLEDDLVLSTPVKFNVL